MRDICDVMKRIRPLLEAAGVDLADFTKLEHAIGFAAPELHARYWRPLCELLAATLPNPTRPDAPAWVRQVSAIIEDREAPQ